MPDRSGPPSCHPACHPVDTVPAGVAGQDARLALRGSCDARTAARHRASVRELLQHAPSAIVVDLGRPRRLSSDAVGLLLWLHAACLERGVTVVVTGPPRRGVGPLWRSGLLTPRADRAPAHPHPGGAHA